MGDTKPKRYYLFFFLCAYVLVYISGEKFFNPMYRSDVMINGVSVTIRYILHEEWRSTHISLSNCGSSFRFSYSYWSSRLSSSCCSNYYSYRHNSGKDLITSWFESYLLLSNWLKISWQENVFQLLMKLTEGSAYTKMIDQIEGELMNVGFTGRFFKTKTVSIIFMMKNYNIFLPSLSQRFCSKLFSATLNFSIMNGFLP